MGKLIGYARVSTRAQDADRQVADLLAADVRRDDLYIDRGGSGREREVEAGNWGLPPVLVDSLT